MVIYGWEYPPESGVTNTSRPISENAPYRIFADFSRDVIGLSLQLAVQNAIFIAILVLIGWSAWSWVAPHVTKQTISEQLAHYGIPISLFGIAACLIKALPALKKFRGFLKAAIARLDRKLYEKRW